MKRSKSFWFLEIRGKDIINYHVFHLTGKLYPYFIGCFHFHCYNYSRFVTSYNHTGLFPLTQYLKCFFYTNILWVYPILYSFRYYALINHSKWPVLNILLDWMSLCQNSISPIKLEFRFGHKQRLYLQQSKICDKERLANAHRKDNGKTLECESGFGLNL